MDSKQLVTALYISALGRAPDKAGLDFWTAQMDAGASLDGVLAGFLNTPESSSLYGSGIADATFLDNLYQTALNRTPDDSGKSYWEERLAELGNRKDVVKEMLFSALDGTGDDHKLLENKIAVGVNFAASKSNDNPYYGKYLMSLVTSDPASVKLAGDVNYLFDNPPSLPLPPSGPQALAMYGKELGYKFGFDNNSFAQGTVTGADGVELSESDINQGFGLAVDITKNSIKVYFENGIQGISYLNGISLVFSDVNNKFSAFKDVKIVSDSLTRSDGSPFGKANFTVTDDVVKIDLSGVALTQGQGVEFSLIG